MRQLMYRLCASICRIRLLCARFVFGPYSMAKLGRLGTVMPRYADAPLAAHDSERETPSAPKMRIGYMNCVVLKPVARTNMSSSWCVPFFIWIPVGVMYEIEEVSRLTFGCRRVG